MDVEVEVLWSRRVPLLMPPDDVEPASTLPVAVRVLLFNAIDPPVSILIAATVAFADKVGVFPECFGTKTSALIDDGARPDALSIQFVICEKSFVNDPSQVMPLAAARMTLKVIGEPVSVDDARI